MVTHRGGPLLRTVRVRDIEHIRGSHIVRVMCLRSFPTMIVNSFCKRFKGRFRVINRQDQTSDSGHSFELSTVHHRISRTGRPIIVGAAKLLMAHIGMVEIEMSIHTYTVKLHILPRSNF